MLPRFVSPDLTILCGRLLNAGLRACADLATRARALGESRALQTALADASALQSWVRQMSSAPFTDHAYVAAIPAERATWEAELTRLTGSSDPLLWSTAAEAWRELGHPHRAGYAWWRQAEAQLDAGQTASHASAALRAAATAADGHAPLQSQVLRLAERARITLDPPRRAEASEASAAALPAVPYGLTKRELAVLRLVATGKTNAQIGAELYISPSTAGVHVSSILRKLGVTGRVQAAAAAERAGLLR
jgi:DNA-binding CsgD family transcriptional regulator